MGEEATRTCVEGVHSLRLLDETIHLVHGVQSFLGTLAVQFKALLYLLS